ncbi:hypothetical protein HHK36_030397 [Tetracentron sinense]|uniref:Phosphatidylinositol 4-phosphate 5-kinase n=1 Tax=Tetracentron sinense TaxID=13715 RepID=A0A834YCF0_TETSI|nr:hypothetical protein HHK36_030397 [Tetracentron sinense]
MQEAFLRDEEESIRNNKQKKFEEEREDLERATVVIPAPFVVGRIRSHSGTRRVTPTATTGGATVGRFLRNGDFYDGNFVGNLPHGAGKYLWSDGCMYEGEWRRGKPSGKGKFSWPSGATFEGEFKSGKMNGFGTLSGSDGDTYRGSWNADREHGFGQKSYVNGDFYVGSWKRNLQQGQGRYAWKNGNEYVGEWKNGVVSGRGVLIWLNGNRYDGQWENGVPKGNGVFTWPDGSCYVGSWSKNLKHQQLNGTFYSGNGTNCSDYQRSSLMEENFQLTTSTMSYEKSFPRICIWESDGDIPCDIIDNVESPMFFRDEGAAGQGLRCCFTGKVEKSGEAISKGHKNYDLMLNLQLGIRCSVGKHASILRDLRPVDFDPMEKFWTRFPPEGSKITPPRHSVEFRWKDYCPMVFSLSGSLPLGLSIFVEFSSIMVVIGLLVFRHLRELFAIDPTDYMLAICGNDTLRELSSPGKSGSFFYMSQDDRFMIKTVKKSECKVLIRMLPSYYHHVRRYENSMVTKFFGVHCVKLVGGHKTRFIVMGNLFSSAHCINRRFDLKGSSHGRMTDKSEEEIDETTTLKDLDLNFLFHLQRSWFQEFFRQIDRDCEFLEAEGIMDYSLLVGLHFCDDYSGDKMELSPFVVHSGKRGSNQGENVMHGCRFIEAELQDMDRILAGQKPLIRLGSHMPARAEKVERRRSSFDQYTPSGRRRSSFDQYTPSGRRSSFDQYTPSGGINSTQSCSGEIYEVVLYFGIIDILQDYDICKKLEHAYKSLQADPTSISAVDPKLYSKRFRDFIHRIFVEDK